MSPFPKATVNDQLATPVVASVVTSLGDHSTGPRIVRPWTHAGYTRWRSAALRSLPVALAVGGVGFVGAGGAPALVVGAALASWLVAGKLMMRHG